MKILTNRQEIAMALNFGKYAVFTLDVTDPKTQYTNWDNKVVGFTNIKARVPHKDFFCEVELGWFCDTNKITFSSYGCCIKSSFGYQDIMKSVEYANSPMVDQGDEFILVLHNSHTKKAMVLKFEIANHKNIHCQTVLEVEEKVHLLELAKELS